MAAYAQLFLKACYYKRSLMVGIVNKSEFIEWEPDTKMGQVHLAIDPFEILVAGTGFEPVTFGL